MYQVGINKGIILRCTAYQISSDSTVTAQCLFCRKFNVEVQFYRIETLYSDGMKHLELLDVTKRKPPGHARSVRSPENVDTVRRAVLASPRRSARRQALALSDILFSVRNLVSTLTLRRLMSYIYIYIWSTHS